MKNLARILSVCLALIYVTNDAKSLDISGSVTHSGDYSVGEDITILAGGNFEAHDLQITDAVHMLNFGEIHGGINVNTGCILELRNVGDFNATVSLESGARFVQLVTNSNEVTNLGLASGYEVLVRDANNLNLNDVMAIAANADYVEIKDSAFSSGTLTGLASPASIVLNGDIVLNLDSVPDEPVLIFSNVTGSHVVRVDAIGLDSLHTLETYSVNQDLFVRLVRSTDYERMLKNNMGRFLNNLRATDTNHKLFAKLDAAESVNDINDILSSSIHTNPVKLMNPIKVMNAQKMLETMHIDDSMTIGVEPFLIYSSDMLLSGIQPNITFNLLDDLHFDVSGYVMDISFSDDINEYDGLSFGVNLDGQYDINKNDYVRANLGGHRAYFDADYVFDGNGSVNKPAGTAIYAGAEYGHGFDLSGGYKLSPFVSVGTEYFNVANADETNTYAAGGINVGYEYADSSLKYSLNARGLGRTDGTFGAGLSISLWSIIDAAGADVHIGAIYNEDLGMSYRASLNGRFMF